MNFSVFDDVIDTAPAALPPWYLGGPGYTPPPLPVLTLQPQPSVTGNYLYSATNHPGPTDIGPATPPSSVTNLPYDPTDPYIGPPIAWPPKQEADPYEVFPTKDQSALSGFDDDYTLDAFVPEGRDASPYIGPPIVEQQQCRCAPGFATIYDANGNCSCVDADPFTPPPAAPAPGVIRQPLGHYPPPHPPRITPASPAADNTIFGFNPLVALIGGAAGIWLLSSMGGEKTTRGSKI